MSKKNQQPKVVTMEDLIVKVRGLEADVGRLRAAIRNHLSGFDEQDILETPQLLALRNALQPSPRFSIGDKVLWPAGQTTPITRIEDGCYIYTYEDEGKPKEGFIDIPAGDRQFIIVL